MDPENISLWHNLALCRMHEEEYAQARADLDTLIRISPRYTDAYLMRTEVSLKQKDTLQAMNDADKAIEMDAIIRIHGRRGVCCSCNAENIRMQKRT